MKVFAYLLVAAGTLEEEINQASLKKELMSKMFFEGSDQHNNSVSLLSKVNVDECGDMLFQGNICEHIIVSMYNMIFCEPMQYMLGKCNARNK